ncbi:hypothetical protein RB595_010195 [Gaeumannomyces hyphopodioides]
MVVKMRLARFGRTNAPFFNIVVAQARTARNSKPMEVIGTYDPIPKTDSYDTSRKLHKDIRLDMTRAKYWIGVGAQPTDTVWRLLSMVRASLPYLCCRLWRAVRGRRHRHAAAAEAVLALTVRYQQRHRSGSFRQGTDHNRTTSRQKTSSRQSRSLPQVRVRPRGGGALFSCTLRPCSFVTASCTKDIGICRHARLCPRSGKDICLALSLASANYNALMCTQIWFLGRAVEV